MAASRGAEEEKSNVRDEGSHRSALMVMALDGFKDLSGMGGKITSVRISWYWGSESRRSARSWPINPAAPVMRTLGIVGGGVVKELGCCTDGGSRNVYIIYTDVYVYPILYNTT